jgi:hypothetical protein
MKQLNLNQMSEFVGGDLSQNQKCMIGGMLAGIAILVVPVFGAGVATAGIFGGFYSCF